MGYYAHSFDCSRKHSHLFSKMVHTAFPFIGLSKTTHLKGRWFKLGLLCVLALYE